MRPPSRFAALIFAVSLLLAHSGHGPADDDIVITIKDHKFSPAEVKIPAGKRVILTVVNDDPTPEEFESKAMKVEKIIPGKSKGTVRVGPLEKGRYNFFGEFNEATAQGWVVVE